MKMKTIAAAAVGIGVLGALFIATPASAHTPKITASCTGVVLDANSYEGNKANKWEVTIGDNTQTGTFGANLNQTFPVPQDGKTTTWSAKIEAYNGSYSTGLKTGTVGPCGDKPVKPEDSVTPYSEETVNCESNVATTKHWEIVVGTEFDTNVWAWVPLAPVRVDLPDTTREVEPGECEVTCPEGEEISNGVCVTPDPPCVEKDGCDPKPPVDTDTPKDPNKGETLAVTGVEDWLPWVIGGVLALGAGLWLFVPSLKPVGKHV